MENFASSLFSGLIFGGIVFLLIFGVTIFFIVYFIRQHFKIKKLQENPEKKEELFNEFVNEAREESQNKKLSEGDIFENIQNISGTKIFESYKKTPLSRKIKFSLYKIGELEPFIFSAGLFIPMKKFVEGLENIFSFSLFDGIIFIKTNNGEILCRLENANLFVYFNNKPIGKINLDKKEIYDSRNKKIGYTDRSLVNVTEVSVMGAGISLPVKYSVFIENKKACDLYPHPSSYGILKSAVKPVALFQDLNPNLDENFKILILGLGIWDSMFFEYNDTGSSSTFSRFRHSRFRRFR